MPLRFDNARTVAVVFGVLLTLAPLAAQGRKQKAEPPPDAATQAEDERDPALAKWPWFVELRPPEAKGTLVAADLPGEVLGRVRLERQGEEDQPADLRLVDAAGARLPYVPRVLRNRLVQRPVAVARRFDAGPDRAGKTFEESF